MSFTFRTLKKSNDDDSESLNASTVQAAIGTKDGSNFIKVPVVVQNANSQFALAIPQELAEQLGLKAEGTLAMQQIRGKAAELPYTTVTLKIAGLVLELNAVIGAPFVTAGYEVARLFDIVLKAGKIVRMAPNEDAVHENTNRQSDQ